MAGADGAQITVERVSHTYRPARGRDVLALADVSLEIAPREFTALLGPSGCGKSTLLYLIGGFLPVEKGAIRIEGAPVAGPDRGIVFQNFALFPYHDPDMKADLKALQANIDLQHQLGLVQATIDVAKHSDLSVIQEAAKRLK